MPGVWAHRGYELNNRINGAQLFESNFARRDYCFRRTPPSPPASLTASRILGFAGTWSIHLLVVALDDQRR
jgi:hypothetical protein